MKSVSCARTGLLLMAAAMGSLSAEARAQEKNPAATRQYAAAVALQNRGEFELAADEWTKFINEYKTDPRCDRAYHYLGVCHLKANKLDTAQQCFQTVLKTFPKSDMIEATHLYLGVTQYTVGQSGKAEMYDAAAATFENLMKLYPKGKHLAQASFYCGESFYARGKKKEAAQMYSQLVEKFPDDKLAPDALYALGVTQEELGDAAAAGKTYDAFLAKFTSNPLATEVGMRRGETLFAANQFKAAAEWFASAAAKQGFAMADYALLRQAACLAQLKQYGEAAALYASIPAKFPQSRHVAAASLAGGKCYFLAGQYADARKLLGALGDAGGDTSLEAVHWIARALLKDKKPAEALSAVEKILPKAGQSPLAAQLLMDQADAVYDTDGRRGQSAALYAALAAKYPKDPIAPQALYMAGFTALGQGDYAPALKHAEAFLAAHPDNELAVDVTCVAAESNLQLSKFIEAEKLFTQLLEKHSNHADAESWKVRRGLSLQLQKKYDDAVKLLLPLLKELKTPDAVAEAQYLIGGSQVELKQYDAAVKSLAASLAAAPKWRQADETLLALAHCYSQSNDLGKAKESIRKLLADFPNSRFLDRAHYRLAEYSSAGSDWKAAAAEYQQVVDQWPQGPLAPYALYGLGWARLNQNDYAGAEKAIDALVEKHADHKLVSRGRYARGMARQQLAKHAAAMEDIQAFLAADPSPAEKTDAQYVLGLCQSGLKKHVEAAATFEAILKENPKPAIADKVYYELGWALKSQDKDQEAAAAFAKVVQTNPDSPLAAESRYHVAESAYKGGDFKNAAADYHAALQKAGKSDLGEKAAHKLGWAYFRLDKFDEGRQTFNYQRVTWPKGPLSSDAAFMEGECFMKLDKFKEALAAYAHVKSPSSKNFEVLTQLHSAQANGQLKQWAKGLAILVKCAEQAADSTYLPEILYEQGWAQQNLGKLPEAAALYERVVAKTDREVGARAQFMIGEIEFEQKKHADAVKSFFKVAYGYSAPKWQAEATYEAGRCFEVLGKKTQAVKQYQELIEKFPDSDKVSTAKERVKSLQ